MASDVASHEQRILNRSRGGRKAAQTAAIVNKARPRLRPLQEDPAGADCAFWASFCLSTRRRSFPVGVRGNSFTKTTSRGSLYLAILSLQYSINCLDVALCPGLSTTKSLAI